MAGQEAIWHVMIGGEQRGPLTRDEVLGYARDGMLAANDFIWRPGLPDWKAVSEISDFRQPAMPAAASVQSLAPDQPASEHVDRDGTGVQSVGRKWSVWKSANIGLLISALTLLVQIGAGRGFELANDAHTASAATFSRLVGQILLAPLIFAGIAVVRNLLRRRQPKSRASAVNGALTFAALLVLILGALAVYGKMFFSRTEAVSGETRMALIAGAARSCVQKQLSSSPNLTASQIDKYCGCISEKMADGTTYQQLGTEPDASALAVLRKKAEAAGYACRMQ
jgi:hypothetical protein